MRIKRRDGDFEELTAIVDTGAAVSLLPISLLDVIQYDDANSTKVVIDQAGVAGQHFEAVETTITIYLEDMLGVRSEEFEIRAWFADSDNPLIGFGGMLERAVFHLDMPNLSGYLEL